MNRDIINRNGRIITTTITTKTTLRFIPSDMIYRGYPDHIHIVLTTVRLVLGHVTDDPYKPIVIMIIIITPTTKPNKKRKKIYIKPMYDNICYGNQKKLPKQFNSGRNITPVSYKSPRPKTRISYPLRVGLRIVHLIVR